MNRINLTFINIAEVCRYPYNSISTECKLYGYERQSIESTMSGSNFLIWLYIDLEKKKPYVYPYV